MCLVLINCCKCVFQHVHCTLYGLLVYLCEWNSLRHCVEQNEGIVFLLLQVTFTLKDISMIQKKIIIWTFIKKFSLHWNLTSTPTYNSICSITIFRFRWFNSLLVSTPFVTVRNSILSLTGDKLFKRTSVSLATVWDEIPICSFPWHCSILRQGNNCYHTALLVVCHLLLFSEFLMFL